jgi:hypothetical protein
MGIRKNIFRLTRTSGNSPQQRNQACTADTVLRD